MKSERIDAVWIEEHRSLSLDDLGERWGLSRTQLGELIAHGVLEPSATQVGQERFTLEAVSVVRTACRLQQELELDPHAVGVVLELLKRLRTLEDELRALKARQPAEIPADDDAPEADVTSRGRH
jgi:chaperone modulatory protein CbpM